MKSQKSKVKSQKYNLKAKSFAFCTLILCLTLGASRLNETNAQTVNTQAIVGQLTITPTTKKLSPTLSVASPSATPTDEKVQEIRDVVKEKVQERIQEIKDKIEKKGYVGTLKEMTDSTLTIDTLTGEKIISVDKDTKIIAANKKEIKVKDLEIDQKIICMGSLDENKILVARRIVVVPPPTQPSPQKEAIIGRVSQIDKKLKTVSLNHLRKLNKQYLVKIDNSTKFSSGKFEDLKVDQILVIVSSTIKENETPTALLVNPLP